MALSGYRMAMRYGEHLAGEWMAELCPADYKRDGTLPLVLVNHGAAQDAFIALSRSAAGAALDLHGQYPLICELARHYVVVVTDAGGAQAWGNNAAVASAAAGVAWGQGAGGAKAGPVFTVGVSMGNLTSLNYGKANPGKVGGHEGIIPVSDLNDIVTNNRGGFAGNVNVAYGGAYSEAVNGPTNNPANYAASIGWPLWLNYSTDDPIVTPATVAALAALAPMGQAFSLGALGHTEDAIAAVTAARVLAHIASAVK